MVREIASIERYHKVWQQAMERENREVLNAIDAALEQYGPRINCAFLHRYLKLRFPMAVMWGSVDHIMTEIGGRLYDKNGLVFERMLAQNPTPQIMRNSFKWPLTNDFLYEDVEGHNG